jgi:hypothetical protein
MASTTKKIVWLCWLLADMRVSLSHHTPLYCDNQSSIQIAHNLVFYERTKHIEINCHLIRHHLKHSTITLPFVSSSLQIVDFFTRLHSISRFHFLVGKLDACSCYVVSLRRDAKKYIYLIVFIKRRIIFLI